MLRSLTLMFSAWWATLLGRFTGRPRHASWPFVFELMIRFLRLDSDSMASWDDARVREELNARPYPNKFIRKVTLTDANLGGVKVVRFLPPKVTTSGCILFFHGGSYVFGSCRTTHGEFVARLALESEREIVGVEYRLAPEHPCPAQLEDALAAFDALVASGANPEKILVAGDSAGGNLALALQLALRDRGGPQGAATLLCSPWVDLTMTATSYSENEPYDYATRDVLYRQAKSFAGPFSLTDARVSPIFSELRRLAPCFVTTGELELPRDDILKFVERLKGAGVPVTLRVAKNMPHNPAIFAEYHPEAMAVFAECVRFIQAHV